MENCEKIKQLEAQMSELISSTRIGPGRERQINFRDTFDARYITPIAKNHIQTGQQLRNRNTYTAPLNESTTPAPPSANTQTVPPNVSANTLSRTTSSQLDIGRIVRNWNVKYSGEPGSSIEEFLERVHECRRLTQLTDNDLLNAMSELLTGSARLWARQTQHEWTSWQEFCSAARACFGVDRKFQQALIKEAQRRTQGDLEPVRSYIFALLTIMSKFEDQWPLEMQLDLLHTNMRPDLQMQVRRSSITSVGQLLERAREAEGIELARRVYQKPPPKETCVMPAEWREDTKATSFNSSTAYTSPVHVSAIESCEKSPNLQSILEKLSEELKTLSTKVAKIDAEQAARKSSMNNRQSSGKHNNGSQERKPKSDKNKDKTPGPTQKYSCWKCSWPGYTKKTCPECAGNENGSQ
uniref:CCHC-type domain-containing protein n=1 Tax=Trichogramma kaykai TaxID=54128 RepID=A0ABD2VSA8_9HYME